MTTLAPIDPCLSGLVDEHEGLVGIAVQSKPAPADVAVTITTSSRQKLEQAPIIQRSLLPPKKRLGKVPIMEKSLLPLKKRAMSDISSGDAESIDMSSDWQLEQPPTIQKSLLPPKKRAMSNSCADYSFLLPPKKRLVDAGGDATSSTFGITDRYDTVTAVPRSSNAIITTISPEQPLQQKKLVHCGKRSRRLFSHALNRTIEEAETSPARAKKKTSRNINKRVRRSTTVPLVPHKTLCPRLHRTIWIMDPSPLAGTPKFSLAVEQHLQSFPKWLLPNMMSNNY